MKTVVDIIEDKKEEKKSYGLSFSSSVKTEKEDGEIVIEEDPGAKKKRGPGRPPKNGGLANTYSTSVEAEGRKGKETLDKKYEKGYLDNARLLYSAIVQTEDMYNTIDEELAHFKSNKSYGGRNRLMHMSNYMNTQVGLINTKITAVRELNSVRNKINDLVLKKEQMMKDTAEDNSDKAVMDSYYALVNAPRYGLPTVRQTLAPSTINTGIGLSGTTIQSSNLVSAPPIVSSSSSSVVERPGDPVVSTNSIDTSFQQYQQNLTPVQKKMIADKDPNIKTVVVYDQSTGNKWFDVVNVVTGVSIPDIQRPAEFLLDAMRVDARNGIAVNSNTNMTFPLVMTGTRAADEL